MNKNGLWSTGTSLYGKNWKQTEKLAEAKTQLTLSWMKLKKVI